MLRGIHKASGSWLGKTIMAGVMGVLVISFAIWGIGDIFRGFGLNSVAKVGSTEISIEQFRQFYNDRLQQLGRQLGRAITPDQARSLGIDRQIIGQFIAETALDEKARSWRLSLSDAEIARLIMNDPNFRGANGQFDRDRFTAADPQCRLQRGALYRRAAPRAAAPADRAERRRRPACADRHAVGAQPVPERKAQHRICRARAGAGRRHCPADAGNAQPNISTSAK